MNQRAFRVIGFIKPLVTNCPTTSSNAPSSPASHDHQVYQSVLDVHRLTDLWHEAFTFMVFKHVSSNQLTHQSLQSARLPCAHTNDHNITCYQSLFNSSAAAQSLTHIR